MHNFKVIKNDGQYRVCDHPYKLVFTGVTVLRQTHLDDVPLKKYNFTQFANIIVGHFQLGLLVYNFQLPIGLIAMQSIH